MIFDHKPNIPAGSFHLFRDIVRPAKAALVAPIFTRVCYET
jgi:hypothetical protein